MSEHLMQAMRIVYPTYESSNAFPGVLLVNIFFVASFGFGIAGGIYQFWQEHRLRRDRPWDFAAGPIELLREGVSRLRRGESLYETFQGMKTALSVQTGSLVSAPESSGGVSSFGYSGTIAHAVLRASARAFILSSAIAPKPRRAFAWLP